MSNIDNIAPDNEEKEAENWFNKTLFGTMNFIGLTSGVGLVGFGAAMFVYHFFRYIFILPQNMMQQIVHENYLNQALMGIIIVALGVLIMTVKKLQQKP